MRALKPSKKYAFIATVLLTGSIQGLRLTDTFTDAHCFDSNNTIIKGNDGGSEFKCMKEFDSYIESLEYHNYLYYDQSLRKFNNSVATCHADATVKTISWLKDGKELVDQCENCSELDLYIQLFPDDFAFYECQVNETDGETTKLTDMERFPLHENYTVSWFECCGGVSYIYLHLDPTTVVTEPPPDKPLIPKESAFNMIYGTLVGIALFVVIVILCWMLSAKLERDKQRKKREEIEKNAKESKRQNKESYDDEEPLI